VVNDRFKNFNLVFFHSERTVSVLDASKISASKSIGSVTVFNPTLDGQLLTFKKRDEYFVDDISGSRWDITGRCIEGRMKGSQLAIVPHSNHFAFAWLAFFPDSEIFE